MKDTLNRYDQSGELFNKSIGYVFFKMFFIAIWAIIISVGMWIISYHLETLEKGIAYNDIAVIVVYGLLVYVQADTAKYIEKHIK